MKEIIILANYVFKVRETFPYLYCSLRAMAFNQCSAEFEEMDAKSNVYTDGFFHRTEFFYENFSETHKKRTKMVDLLVLRSIIYFVISRFQITWCWLRLFIYQESLI